MKNNIKTDASELISSEKIDQYIAVEDLDKDYIDSIYKKNPNNINILLKRADLYYDNNQAHISRDCWERCVEIDSNNKICSEKLVDLYCTIGDKNCEKSIDYLLGIDSNNLIALYFQAKLKKDQGENQLAINSYKKILDIEPNNVNALGDLAVLYTQEGNELAIIYFEKLLKAKPTDQVYYNYGYYFQSQGDFEEAIEKYKLSVSMNEKNADSYYSMGYCLLEIAQVEKDALKKRDLLHKALNKFQKTIDSTSDTFKNLQSLYAQAVCYTYMGNKEDAIEKYKFCLMIEPGYEPAMNGILELEKNN